MSFKPSAWTYRKGRYLALFFSEVRILQSTWGCGSAGGNVLEKKENI